MFLIKRGIWLVIAEVFIVGLGWTFDPLYHLLILQVIWAIGVSMILLGLLVWLPYTVILVLSLAIILGHNLMDFPQIGNEVHGGVVSELAYFGVFKILSLSSTHSAIVVYSFLPWTALMMLGYCFGKLYMSQTDAKRRQRMVMTIGISVTAFFILLRFLNVYGDPLPWSPQPRGPLYTFLSFLNANKYPPSLLFMSMTIGPALIMLSLLERWNNRFTAIMNIYGRVPMFYYILHFYIIHIIVVIVFYASGYTSKDIITPGVPFLFKPPTFGLPLWSFILYG